MSAIGELSWLDRENAEIQQETPATDAGWAAWWYRLANWWHRRDLSFGDGAEMKAECTIQANRLVEGKACEFCGDSATTVEVFDRAGFVCDACGAQEFNQ